jgi:hypothetical protein
MPRRRILLLSILTALFVLAVMEISSRAYWAISHGVSFFDPLEVEHAFYPELAALEAVEMARDDEVLDVLLLGGSVLTTDWGRVPRALEHTLSRQWGGPLRIHNLAAAGHMSRDSLNKYRFLADKRFDAVLIYHSVNEIRTNNAPPERFRSDYTHLDWYRQVNFATAHRSLDTVTTLPVTALTMWLTFKGRAGFNPAIGTEWPLEEYLKYGAEVKSAATLEANLREILLLARQRGDPVVLASYAWYVPDDYSYQRFEERALDYRYERRFVPLEVWGQADHVILGLREHNRVLHRLGQTDLVARFVDVDASIPKEGRYWSDVCHLSGKGAQLFARVIVPALLEVSGAVASGTGEGRVPEDEDSPGVV